MVKNIVLFASVLSFCATLGSVAEAMNSDEKSFVPKKVSKPVYRQTTMEYMVVDSPWKIMEKADRKKNAEREKKIAKAKEKQVAWRGEQFFLKKNLSKE